MYRPRSTPELALAAAKEYIRENGPIEFEGMDCNDYLEEEDLFPCTGWDGVDRRCDCGNHRVSWEIEKTLNGTFCAVARTH